MNFNKDQKKAIQKVYGNVAVIATAGSGKTSVLTKRIANMIEEGIDPKSILAITFSRKAKEHMAEKLKDLTSVSELVNIETFHSLAFKIIKSAYGNKYRLWDLGWQKERLVGEICQSLGLSSKEDAPYNQIYGFIAVQKNHMLKPEDRLVEYSEMPYKMKYMKIIYERYEKYKKDNDLIEFDDFLNMACDILRKDKEVLEFYREKSKYILSDEYQDVSENQAKLLKYLGVANNNFIVGDLLQSIYAFRGGMSKYMVDFDRKWSDVTVINLNINYRCSANIVKAANTFAKHIPDSHHRHYVEANANNKSFKIPVFTPYKNTRDEGENISNKIKALLNEGYAYDDFAILARTNAQLQKITAVLFDNDVPFDTSEGQMFTDLPEIKLLMSLLRLGEDESDDEAFEYCYNKPLRWLDKKFLEEVKGYSRKFGKSLFVSMNYISRREWRFKKGIDELQEVVFRLSRMKSQGIQKQIEYLRRRLKIDDFASKGKVGDDGMSEQSENMDSFADMSNDFSTVKEMDDYLKKLSAAEVVGSNKGKVKLLTIHRSKGLEFPIVFIIGCNDDLLPHGRSFDLNDEKRLMYVAITRAEKELYISSVEQYNGKLYKVSPFIEMMGDTIIKEDDNE